MDRTGIFAGDDPFAIAAGWLAEAEPQEPNDPNAIALATVDAAGLPNVRMVLLKEIEAEAFVFYTNYGSQKAVEIETSGKAAFVLHWKSLRRQIRVRGLVEREGGGAGRRLLRLAVAQEPARGMGLGAEPPARLAHQPSGRSGPRHGTLRNQPSAPRVLGWFQDQAARDRVLGGRRLPPARPFPLAQEQSVGRLVDRAAEPVIFALRE